MALIDKRKAPLTGINRTLTTVGGSVIEVLSCGHMQDQPRDIYGRPTEATHRRCAGCKIGERKDAVIAGQTGSHVVIVSLAWANLVARCVTTDQLTTVRSPHFPR